MGAEDLQARLRAFAGEFDDRFPAFLQPAAEVPPELLEAMQYTACAPGKRLRPFLASRCCELVGGHRDGAWHVGAAVECIHAFSLIHDDLPAMDDDEMRRGRPTCHVKFGEAVAILAGDALSLLGIDLLIRHTPDPGRATQLVEALTAGAGWSGMIGGQTVDILGQQREPSLELTRYIHARKTAALFAAACKMGAIAGGGLSDEIDALAAYGRDLGQAFQIADDLLDVTSSAEAMGKSVQKDDGASKQTFPRCVGVEESRRRAREMAGTAETHLARFGPAADDLRALLGYIVDRNY